MSAARLDPFSARLHAIHRRGAKAKPPKPALQEGSAPKGVATTGMPVREEEARRLLRHLPGDDEYEGQGSMSYAPDEDEGQGSMSYVSVNDGQGSMSYVAADDDEPPRPGHFAPNIPRDYHEPESPRNATNDADLSGRAPASGHRPVSGWGRGRDDEDAQDRIRELMRRMSALELEMSDLKDQLYQQGALRPRTPGGTYIEGSGWGNPQS